MGSIETISKQTLLAYLERVADEEERERDAAPLYSEARRACNERISLLIAISADVTYDRIAALAAGKRG